MTRATFERMRRAGLAAGADGTVTVEGAKVGGQSLGAMTFAPIEAENDARLTSRADGLLGLDVLARFRVGIDPRERTMRLWPLDRPLEAVRREWLAPPDGGKAAPEPAAEVGSVGLSLGNDGLYTVPVRLDGAFVPMCLDTGTMYSCVFARTARSLDWTDVVERNSLAYPSGAVPIVFYRIKALGLGKLTVPDVKVGAREGSDTDAILGFNVLDGVRTLLDFSGKRAYFAPLGG